MSEEKNYKLSSQEVKQNTLKPAILLCVQAACLSIAFNPPEGIDAMVKLWLKNAANHPEDLSWQKNVAYGLMVNNEKYKIDWANFAAKRKEIEASLQEACYDVIQKIA